MEWFGTEAITRRLICMDAKRSRYRRIERKVEKSVQYLTFMVLVSSDRKPC